MILLAGTAFSQTRNGTTIGTVEYSTAYNMGRAADYLGDPSFAGASLTFKRFVKDNVSIGLEFNWNVFSEEEENGFTEFKNGAVSGAQARYINYIPIYLTAGYHFNQSKRSTFIPYIQANVGASYIGQRLQLGVNVIDNDNWHFMFGPEAGFLYVIGSDILLTVNGKYNYALSSGDPLGSSSDDDSNDYSFINANIGIGYYLR